MARKIRIYTQVDLAVGGVAILENAASHHCIQVLRLSPGKRITLFNGDGCEYEVEIRSCSRGGVEFVVLSIDENIDCESPLEIHLAQGLSRSQKMDFVIQKAVECGVRHITPLLTERSGVKIPPEKIKKKQAHWQQVAISACEQSGRCVIPVVHEPVSFFDYVSMHTEIKFVAHVAAGSQSNDFVGIKKAHVLVGPEGGFSDSEILYAKKTHCELITLGPRVLRTETAPIVAVTLLQSRYGDINF